MSLNICIIQNLLRIYILSTFFLFSFNSEKAQHCRWKNEFSHRYCNWLSHKGFNGCIWVGPADIRYVYSDAETSKLNRRTRKNLDLTLICCKQKCYILLAETPFTFRRINPYEAVFELLRRELVVFNLFV